MTQRALLLVMLVIVGTGSIPMSAGAGSAPPNTIRHIPWESRGGWVGALRDSRNRTSTISGTRLAGQSPDIMALNYPGACRDLALGVYSPHPLGGVEFLSAAKDSNSKETCGLSTSDCAKYYDACVAPNPVPWHVISFTDPTAERPAILTGTRSLWCGTYNSNWSHPVGYPDNAYEMLYVDTGAHSGSYEFTFKMSFSAQWTFDFVHVIGGGSGQRDPLGNDWSQVGEIIRGGVGGPMGTSERLISWSGSIQKDQPPGNTIVNTITNHPVFVGAYADPETLTMTLTIAPGHRALYFVFVSNHEISSQGATVGTWSWGQGQVLDNLRAWDASAPVYTDEAPLGVPDPVDSNNASIIKGTFNGSAWEPIVSSRSRPREVCWDMAAVGVPTVDICSPSESSPTDSQWVAPTFAPGLLQSAAVQSCTFPVPPGVAELIVVWTQFMDLPEGSGNVQVTEHRFFKNGSWSSWHNSSPSGAVRNGADQSWELEFDELPEATQADSVQLRFWVQCIPELAADGVNCAPLNPGLIYDDLGLFAIMGTPAPVFGIFPGSLAQTTFVDGGMLGVNCTLAPCWPGPRGTDLGAGIGINDNVNSVTGDSIVVSILTALRTRGMGVNWHQGFDKSISGGTVIAHTNGAFNPAYGAPRVVYRLFDPATKTWSSMDSTELDADDVVVSGVDTTVVGNNFRMDWPPRDKAGLNLPGGFTINGIAAYNNLKFLPRGTRVQYYFKAVDILGGTAYQFQSDAAALEVEDLPTLPGGTAKPPDIVEFSVLPRTYPVGTGGSLLAGRTNTPLLDLDGSYTGWSFQMDPIRQALRGLGVRADRYRRLQASGYGNGIGGHELTGAPDGQPPRRLTNFHPNMTEYSIRESLSVWYRILLQPSNDGSGRLDDEADARLITEWWNSATPGTNGGDRCLFASGDGYVNALLNVSIGDPNVRRAAYAQGVLGVMSATDSWNGTAAVSYPIVDDRFAAPGAVGQQGVPLAALGYNYPVDGGCPTQNRFDAFTKIGSSTAQNAAFYPLFSGVTNVAAVAMMDEKDIITDKDRNKALTYGNSIQFVRKTGIPTTAANYVHSGVLERMQILYKFLASCRGARTGAAGDTAKCWPCPTDANMTGNWAALGGFQTSQYGPLYAIQDGAAVTGIEVGVQSPPVRNLLGQNRPNPFNPSTVIPYGTAAAGLVTIRIYDVGGRLVRTLEQGVRPAGEHVARWDGRLQRGESAGSGVYFYRIEYPGGGVSSKKMILLR